MINKLQLNRLERGNNDQIRNDRMEKLKGDLKSAVESGDAEKAKSVFARMPKLRELFGRSENSNLSKLTKAIESGDMKSAKSLMAEIEKEQKGQPIRNPRPKPAQQLEEVKLEERRPTGAPIFLGESKNITQAVQVKESKESLNLFA
jgi:hypothetical protein